MEKLKVLIAIDDPNFAKTIIHTACSIINKKNSEVTLLNVEEITTAEDEYFYKEPEKFIEHEAEKSDFAYLENFLENQKDLEYKGFIYQEGNAADNILAIAEKENYDLIVLGSHNKHGFERFFLGSASYKVSRMSKCSVLVIKPEFEIVDSEPYSVLFATDGSELSSYVSSHVSKFLDKNRAEVDLLNVVALIQDIIPADTYVYANIDKIIEESNQVSDEILKNTAIDLLRQGLNIKKRYHVNGIPAETILDEAENNNSDLIVLGSHSFGGNSRWLLGSVSSGVYEYSHIPVLIVKEH